MKETKENDLSSAATTKYDPDEGPRTTSMKGNTKLIFPLAGLLLGIALGLGYYAWSLWSEQQTTSKALTTAKTAVAELKRGQSEAQQKVTLLETEGENRESELRDAKARITDLEMQLSATEATLGKIKEKSTETKQRLSEYRALALQFKRMVDSGKLEVNFRRGRMIVQMPEDVLFPSGSADLTPEGNEALRDLAKILKNVPSKRFVVAGHTDSVPISNDKFRSNWELSTARSVNVLQSLIRSGIDPARLSAAGFAQYDPISNNTKEAGRKHNRRIEVVLEPHLKEFPEKTEPTKSKKK
jgi:chemotaxis protein MotB